MNNISLGRSTYCGLNNQGARRDAVCRWRISQRATMHATRRVVQCTRFFRYLHILLEWQTCFCGWKVHGMRFICEIIALSWRRCLVSMACKRYRALPYVLLFAIEAWCWFAAESCTAPILLLRFVNNTRKFAALGRMRTKPHRRYGHASRKLGTRDRDRVGVDTLEQTAATERCSR